MEVDDEDDDWGDVDDEDDNGFGDDGDGFNGFDTRGFDDSNEASETKVQTLRAYAFGGVSIPLFFTSGTVCASRAPCILLQ